jgi:Glycosyl hydrolases family 43/Ricin-type beta-trefoil lectin domain
MKLHEHSTAGGMGPRNARGIGLLAAAVLPVALFAQTAAADEPAEEPQGQIPLTGSVAVHDPAMFTDGERYYVVATNNSVRSAPTMAGPWTVHGNVSKADWTFNVSPGGLWAPHVVQIGDTFYYYYSQSNFGSNNSAIGLKTTTTPQIPASYVDHGEPVVVSGAQIPGYDPTDPSFPQYNAIDPSVYQDDEGDWWITWGSHFDGIYIQRLADDMVTVLGEPELLAYRGSDDFPLQQHPDDPGWRNTAYTNRVEGPSIFERNGYYYLMTGWDWCCQGANSTYKVVIGRSENIAGPYVDKNGVPLTEGGGSIILNSRVAEPGVTPTGLYRAPGAPEVFVEQGVYYLTYHAYRPQNTLGIRPMNWHDGWPYFNEPGGGPYDLADRAYYRLVNQDGIISNPNSLHNPVASDRCLTAVKGDVVQRQCDDSLDQVWELQIEADGFWRFRSMSETTGHCLEMSDESGEVGTDVVVGPCDEGEALQEWYLDDAGHGFHRPVVKHANLALEIENVCTPPLSYNCDGVIGSNVVGGFRRDGAHTPSPDPFVRRDDAAKWPPQQWRLSMVAVTPELLLAAFDGFVADGRVVRHGPGASAPNRLNALRNKLVAALAAVDAGQIDTALAQLSDVQAHIHAAGTVRPSHFATGGDTGTLDALIESVKEAIADN